MIGTFVNMGTIILGSLIGGIVRKVIKEEYSRCLFTAMGACSNRAWDKRGSSEHV